MANANDFIVKNGLVVSTTATIRSDTNSSSTTTGALIVSGGAGVALDLRVGGTIYSPNVIGLITTATNLAGGQLGSIPFQTSSGLTNFINIGSINYALVSNGTTATWQAVVNSLSAGTDTAISSTTGSILIWNTSTLQSITQRGATTNQAISITNITSSTSVSSGALIITGGLGVGDSLYAGKLYDDNNRVVTRVVPSGSTYIGLESVVSAGTATSFTIKNLGVQTLTAGTDTAVSANTGTITVWNTSTLQTVTGRGASTNNAISITNTTSAISTTTGALTVAGGVGIQGDLWVGGAITAEQLTIQYTTITSVSTVIDDITTIKNGTQSNNTQSGALQVWGGAGIGGNLYVGGTINGTIVGSITGIATTATNIQNGTAGQVPYQTAPGLTSFYGPGTAGDILVSNGTSAPAYQNTLTLTGTTLSASTTTGALQVRGGIGVGGGIFVGATVTATSFVGTTATIVTYRAGTGGVNDLIITSNSITRVGGSITITGGNNGSPSITGASGIVAGNDGPLDLYSGSGGNINLRTNQNFSTVIVSTSATNSTVTGALQVAGGIGVGGGIFAGGTVTATLFVGNLTGVATTATNLAGGNLGSIPYQTSTGTTAFIGIGANNTVLFSNGNTATWVSTASLFASIAVNAATPTTLGTVFGYTTGNGNTAIGCCSGNITQTGSNNFAAGCSALAGNTTGNGNIAIGCNALLCNTGGCVNIALGTGALRCNNTGLTNIAVGSGALTNNIFGSCNVAFGQAALCSNTQGCSNFAVGFLTLGFNTTGSGNIGLGVGALTNNTVGNNNVAVGLSALCSNTTGCNNIALGLNAGCSITTGSFNVIIGSNTGNSISTTSCNIIISDGSGTSRIRINSSGAQAYDTAGTNFGSNGNLLQSSGTTAPPTWVSTSSITVGGAVNLAGGTTGAIPYQTTTGTTAFIGIGANNTVLFSNGTTATWVSTSSILGAVTVPLATPTVPGTVFGYTTGNGNTAIGCCSGNTIQTGANNFAAGCLALCANTTGCSNIAIGGVALWCNQIGSNNIALGCNALRNNNNADNNFAAGNGALQTNTTGTNNTAIGCLSLNSNTTGSNNFAVGGCALAFNTIGNNNVAIGLCALRVNGTGSNNFAVGYQAMIKNLIGCDNVAIGYHAAYGTIASNGGNNNIAIGCQALCKIDSGTDNIALGYQALTANTIGYGNIAVGYKATVGACDGCLNTAIGYCATGSRGCQNIHIGTRSGSTSTTASPVDNIAIGAGTLSKDRFGPNIAIGCMSMCDNLTGSYNVAIGLGAMQSSIGSISNVAVGTYGLSNLRQGTLNVAIGDSTLPFNTVGRCQVAIGANALYCHLTGCSNVAVGPTSLINLVQGSCNIAIGRRAGCDITTASSFNTLLGAYSGLFHNCSCSNVILSDGAGNVRLWFTATGAMSFSTATDFGSSGFVLQSNGAGAPPNWQSVGALSAGQATTATNLAGGALGSIPYQTAPGSTAFIGIGANNTVLFSNGTTATWVSTASILSAVTVPPAQPTILGTVFGYTTGNGNTAIGCCSGNITQTGPNNFAIGCCSLRNNTTGCNNIAIGTGTLLTNTVGTDNFAAGYNALLSNTSGCNNTAIGCCALYANTTGLSNTAIGWGALRANTGGFSNIAVGTEALCCNVTGSGNIALGTGALQQNVFGSDNVGIGCQSLQYNSCGTFNIAVGKNAMTGNTAGCRNVAVGWVALCKNTTGNDNIAIGANALFNNTTGISNIGIGCNAGCAITIGSYNVIVGSNNGSTIATSNCNIIISDGAGNARICASNTGSILIPSTNNSVSTQTGALQVQGGLGVGGNVSLGLNSNLLLGTHGKVFDDGNFHIHSITDGSLWINNEVGDVRINNQFNGNVILTSGVGNVQILSTQVSTTTATGALTVVGGVGVGGALNVGGDVNIRGATTFQGNVTFAGSSTNIYSTNTIYTDNLLNMHVPVGSSGTNHSWLVDDGRDIGFVFHYYDSGDKDAALVLGNDSKYLEWYSNGSENLNNGTFTGTAYGIFKTGGIQLVGGTTSTSISTGDLVITGGAGIAGNLWVGGTINASVTGVSTTATNLAGGTTGSIPYQSSAGVTSFIGIGGANTVLTSNGTTATWVATQPGATVVDNITTNATYYPVFSTSTSGAFSQATISSTKLTWNPSTGQLNVVDINTTSDIAAKDNIDLIENPLDLLKQISGFAFNWRDTGAKSYGVIAQYLEKILPELVSEDQYGLKSVKYLPLIAILIESVKALSTEIEEMKQAGK